MGAVFGSKWPLCEMERSAKNLVETSVGRLHFGDKSNAVKRERSLYDVSELLRIVPYEYPFSNGRFVHHCTVKSQV